jgi:hypothetical protein
MHYSSLRAFQRHQEHDLKHPKVMEPTWAHALLLLLIESFPKTPRTRFEAFGVWWWDLITTKQNKTKQTTFLHR